MLDREFLSKCSYNRILSFTFFFWNNFFFAFYKKKKVFALKSRSIISTMSIQWQAPRHTSNLRWETCYAFEVLRSRTRRVRNLHNDDSKIATHQVITPKKGLGPLLQKVLVPVGLITTNHQFLLRNDCLLIYLYLP